ncbi:MerR family transcriptional regulator [Streptomyces deserti]
MAVRDPLGRARPYDAGLGGDHEVVAVGVQGLGGGSVMKIGELARETGVSVRLLRYYEEQGLLDADRTPGGQRVYGAGAPATVRRIRALPDAGLPTRLIREVLDCVCGSRTEVEPCLTPLLVDHLQGIEERIARLEGSRRSLSGCSPRWPSRIASPVGVPVRPCHAGSTRRGGDDVWATARDQWV